jgi:hypothetical protein
VSAPLFAFLFDSVFLAAGVAGGAVSVPVIIHLLNRKRFRVVTWAAMRFLLAAQRKNARRMRLEQLLLLIVRCLIVLLLLLAMASVTPWAEAVWRWFSPEGGVAATTTGRRTHKILVVDGSMSMALNQGDTTSFDRARAWARHIVEQGAGNDGFSVVLMTSPPRRIIPEPSEDGHKVLAEIDNLQVTHGNADLPSTLNTVESLLRASPGKFLDKEVYFLTDLQRSTWIAPRPGLLAATLAKIEARATTVFVDVGKEEAGNLAISDLQLAEPIATTGWPTPIIATLVNHGDTRDVVSVRLFIGKARSKAGEPPANPREVAEVLVRRLKRGQPTPVPFQYKFPEPGDYLVQVQAAHDSLQPDDLRSAVVTVKDTVPVLLVNGKPAPLIYDRATEWLRNALNPFEEEQPPANIVARPKVLSLSQFADEGLGSLSDTDVVFLCDVPRFSHAEVRRLERHVRRGGGVVISLGDRVDLADYNDLLYRDGAGLMPARLLGLQRAENGYNYQFSLSAEAERQEPLKAFRDSAAREQLMAPRFGTFVQAEPAPRRRGGRPEELLSFVPVELPSAGTTQKKTPPPGGPALLAWHPPIPREEAEESGGSGRMRGWVILITTTVNCDWTNWGAIPFYPAFMQELMHFAAAGRLREQALDACAPLELFLPEVNGALNASLETPAGQTHALKTTPLAEGTVLRWLNTQTRGIYRASIGSDPREYLFAVNVPAQNETQQTESDLLRTNQDELANVYPEWNVQVVEDPAKVVPRPKGEDEVSFVLQPLGGEVARWLLLAVLVLVLLEVLLAWLFGHYTTAFHPGESGGPWMAWWKRWIPLALAGGLFLFAILSAAILLHDAYSGDFLAFLPEGARHGVERVLDIPPPAPGEGSRWRLEYTPYFWDAQADPWLAGSLLALAGAGIFAVYLFEVRSSFARSPLASQPHAAGHGMSGRSVAYQVLLVGLRMVLLLLLLVILLPQLRLWFERQGWPDVVILIDDSASMSTVDDYRDPRIKEVADRLAKKMELTELNRLQLAQALMLRSDQDWLTTLLTRRQVRVHVYHCSHRAHRLSDVHSAEEIEQGLEAIEKLEAKPENDSSQLGVAVRQVLNDFRGSSLAAVVMLTDGVTTEGEDLAKVSKYSVQMGVPLYFVGIGDAREVRDLHLHDLQVEESVYVNDRVVFEVQLTCRGEGSLRVPVTLHEKGKQEVLDSKTVEVGGSRKTIKVRLIHQPTEPGEKMYEIRVPVQPDEAEKENNRISRPVFVQEAKLLKVLYVEGYRRYEYHYIKSLLERESDRIKGNKSIDLKVLLLNADVDFAAEDRSALSDWPTRKELESFDVVILGDVDPRPRGDNKMTEHLKDVAHFVLERGGGLLMISGERYAPRYYKDSPLKDVLPIDVTTDPPPEDRQVGRVIVNTFRPELTPTGRLHPIFRFSPDEKENDRIWNELKEMYWFAEGYVPKRAAEVLVVHPEVRAEGKAASGGSGSALADRHPLVLQQFVGAGRSMFFGIHETWRWGFRTDQLHFNHFWIQVIRYLARSRLGRVQLRLDQQTPYRRGDPIQVLVRFPDDAPPPAEDTEVRVVVERRRPNRPGDVSHRTIQLAKLTGTRGTYQTRLTQTPEGDYTFWLSDPSATPRPRAEAKVKAPPGEMEKLQMNATDMERAAEETQGRFYTLGQSQRVLEELPVGTRVTVNAPGPPWLLWNHFALFLVGLLLLTTEWVLRKQMNLL